MASFETSTELTSNSARPRASTSQGARVLVMAQGESRQLSTSDQANVRVSHGHVLGASHFDSRTILLVARRPGTTTLHVGHQSYRVEVLPSRVFRDYLKLKEVLQPLKGLQLEVFDQKLHIGGVLWRLGDWRRLADSGGTYSWRAQLAPEIEELAQSHLETVLRKQGLAQVRLELGRGTGARALVPQGQPELLESTRSALQPYGFEVELDPSALGLAPLVRMQVILAEVSRQWGRQMGLEWGLNYQAQVLPQFHQEGGLLVSLQALESRGEGQILASPNLLCRSGGEAEFLAGGEFPIRTGGFGRRQVEWKSHGVRLHFKPLADSSGRMSIELTAEVSLIDPGVSVDGIPALKTNRIQSHFDLSESKTLVLSGLLREQSGLSREGLPLLSQLPVIGPLFSSQNYLREKSELIVFVTPELLNSQAPTPKPVPTNSKQGENDAEAP